MREEITERRRKTRTPGLSAKLMFTLLLVLFCAVIISGNDRKNQIDIYRQVKLAIVGDLMSHDEQLAAALNNQTGEYDFNYAFREVSQYLQSADLTIGNLETVLAGAETGYSGYPRFNSPDAYAAAIAAAGFDLLTTANNHSNDRNEPGIFRTLEILDQYGIGHIGTYNSAEAREEIKLVTINSVSFAFLSYSYGTNGIPLVQGHEWSVNPLDKDLIYNDIQRAKDLGPDFIIVLPHMGDEYAEEPSERYKEWVRF
ncbi:MAG: CapA family protein, partial [Clostridiales bacterium]|nr:CapA family protein [Clostridiales bacterium]